MAREPTVRQLHLFRLLTHPPHRGPVLSGRVTVRVGDGPAFEVRVASWEARVRRALRGMGAPDPGTFSSRNMVPVLRAVAWPHVHFGAGATVWCLPGGKDVLDLVAHQARESLAEAITHELVGETLT